MSDSILERATHPEQYDRPELKWDQEGDPDSPMRRFMLSYLTPAIGYVENQAVLDVGCGSGWLLNHTVERGASKAVGIDSSSRNISKAKRTYPGIYFNKDALESFNSPIQFDLVTAIMVFEHLGDVDTSFAQLKALVKPSGRLIAMVGDFTSFTRERFNYKIKREPLVDGSVAIEVERPNSTGVMCDIIRPLDHYIAAGKNAGFTHAGTTPMTPTQQLLDQEPRFKQFPDDAIFQLIVFERAV